MSFAYYCIREYSVYFKCKRCHIFGNNQKPSFYRYTYIYGVVAAKRDLAHVIKIFQQGTSKLTNAIKCTAA